VGYRDAGGYVYDGYMEHKGIIYYVEGVPQLLGLISPKAWGEWEKASAEIARLKSLLEKEA